MTQTDTDIAIIGGGISGLAVADGLVSHGKTVQLFEARKRLGGRIQSVPIAGGIAEMGATWFWDNEPRVRALVNDFGMAVHDQWESGDSLVNHQGRLARHRRPWSTNSRRFSDGASQLIEGLAHRLPDKTLHLNCPVVSVKQADGYLDVRLKSRSIRARRVVLALPPSLAIAHKIIDCSALDPELQDAATRIPVWMGAIVKAVTVYDKPFWRLDGLSGSASSQLGPMHEIHDISGANNAPGILFGFGQTHPAAGNLTSRAVVEQLATLFGPKANDPSDVVIQDWRQQKWTTPDIWPPSERYDLFGHPALRRSAWGGTLFWSSTETASVAPGHIEGALEAAERTIASITSLRP